MDFNFPLFKSYKTNTCFIFILLHLYNSIIFVDPITKEMEEDLGPNGLARLPGGNPAGAQCPVLKRTGRCPNAACSYSHVPKIVVAAAAAPAQVAPASAAEQEVAEKCPICQGALTLAPVCTLSCAHTFHSSCVEELKSFDINQACLLCRAELPPGPEKLVDEAVRRYVVVERRLGACGAWVADHMSTAQKWEMKRVIGMFEAAAEQGNVKAQSALGTMYFKGHGVKQDYVKAMKLFLTGGAQGHANSQTFLGLLYAEGKGVEQDFGEARRWFTQAADQGNANAQNNLGIMTAQGNGVTKDHVEAVSFWSKAAAQGHPSAQYSLGRCYAMGEGVPQDYGAAQSWWVKAAEYGHVKAQSDLGTMYFKGDGVKKDYDESLRWYNMAAAQGDAEAKKAVLGMPAFVEEELRMQRKAAAAVIQPSPVRTCDNCGVAAAAGSIKLKPCARCKSVVYCGKDCQLKHWVGGHKAACRP